MSLPRIPVLLAALVCAAGCRPSDGYDAPAQAASPATVAAPAAATTVAPAASANAAPVPAASVPAGASTAAPATGDQPTREYTGWYVLKGGVARFQPCGSASTWRIGQGADLAERARGLALEDDIPVYVRLNGRQRGDVLDVASVVQFGASTPVDDCPMEGAAPPEAR